METYKITKEFRNDEKEIVNIIFNIKSNKPIDNEMIENIKGLELTVFFNNMDSQHYSFDTKLDNGLWLENIFYNNEMTLATALIHQ